MPGAAAGVAGFAGSGLIGVADQFNQAFLNRESRQWSERMYQRQYDDNIKLWNLQNEYNTPANQMARFKAAGLNPNLVYSQGNPGNAIALKSPDASTPQFNRAQSPNIIGDGLSFISAIQDFNLKEAQIDNVRAQNAVIQQEAVLKGVQTDRGRFELEQGRSLAPYQLDMRKAQLDKVRADTRYTIDQNARAAATNVTSIQEAIERMKTMESRRYTDQLQRAKTREEIRSIQLERSRTMQQIEALKNDNTLKKLDIELRQQGINPNDPTWMQMIGRAMAAAVNPDTDTPNIYRYLWRMFSSSH